MNRSLMKNQISMYIFFGPDADLNGYWKISCKFRLPAFQNTIPVHFVKLFSSKTIWTFGIFMLTYSNMYLLLFVDTYYRLKYFSRVMIVLSMVTHWKKYSKVFPQFPPALQSSVKKRAKNGPKWKMGGFVIK